MHCQLAHQDLCRWIMVITQIEQNRIETAAPGTVEKMKIATGKRHGSTQKRTATNDMK